MRFECHVGSDNAGNATIIVVTHDLDIAGKTDRVFKLDDGRLV